MAATQQRPNAAARNADSRAQTAATVAWWKWACGLTMAYVCYGAFYIAKGAKGFSGGSGDTARIVFFHVPVAILSYVAYVVATVHAVRYLSRSRRGSGEASLYEQDRERGKFKGYLSRQASGEAPLDTDAKSAIAMELGFLFCILATATGSVFSGAQWNSFWNWDPRQTSIVVMLLLYASYLTLRGAVASQPEKRARLSAVYTFVALVPATFLIWVVPRIPALQSLHPVNVVANSSGTSWDYKAVLYPSFLAFSFLFAWLFQLRYRLYKLASRRENSRA